MEQVTDVDGSSAMVYGAVRGVIRSFVRLGVGFYETVTFPFPLANGSFEPLLRQPIPWVQRGYEEFPPELGFDSRYDYCRIQSGSTRMP